MTVLVVAALLALLVSTVVAPWVDAQRKRRAELDRLGRIDFDGRRTAAPRFTRDDPSPRPRVARLVADGVACQDRDSALRQRAEWEAS